MSCTLGAEPVSVTPSNRAHFPRAIVVQQDFFLSVFAADRHHATVLITFGPLAKCFSASNLTFQLKATIAPQIICTAQHLEGL